MSNYASVLNTANVVTLARGFWEALTHPVEGDPLSLAPSISSMPSKLKTLAALRRDVEALNMWDEQYDALESKRQALRNKLTRFDYACYYFSLRGYLLNVYRLGVFFVFLVGLSLGLMAVFVEPSTADVGNDHSTSAHAMLKNYCERVPDNIRGAYFDFWAIWFIMAAYCILSTIVSARNMVAYAQARARVGGCGACAGEHRQRGGAEGRSSRSWGVCGAAWIGWRFGGEDAGRDWAFIS